MSNFRLFTWCKVTIYKFYYYYYSYINFLHHQLTRDEWAAVTTCILTYIWFGFVWIEHSPSTSELRSIPHIQHGESADSLLVCCGINMVIWLQPTPRRILLVSSLILFMDDVCLVQHISNRGVSFRPSGKLLVRRTVSQVWDAEKQWK